MLDDARSKNLDIAILIYIYILEYMISQLTAERGKVNIANVYK